MKRVVIYLSVVTFLGFGCSKEDVPTDCMGEAKEIACYQNYDPVCGCNGITYGNACMASASGVMSFVKGECK